MDVCACDLHVDFIAIIVGIFVGWSGMFWWSFAVFFCKKIKKETEKNRSRRAHAQPCGNAGLPAAPRLQVFLFF